MNTPKTGFNNFHELNALTIDKAPLDFSTLKGQASDVGRQRFVIVFAAPWTSTSFEVRE